MRFKIVSFLLILSLIFTTVVFAKEVTFETAKNAALSHIKIFKKYGKLKPEKLLNGMALQQYARISGTRNLYERDNKILLGYIIDLEPQGYIVISVDTDIEPVIAYSFRNNFSMEDGPQNILFDMLRTDLKNRMDLLQQTSSTLKTKNNQSWNELCSTESNEPKPMPTMTDWGPWVDTHWDQDSPYNNSCPMDPNTGQRCITGCVATAMAQIVNYWEYPSSVVFTESDNYTSVYNPGDGHGTRVIDIYAPDASMYGINYSGPSTQTIADLHFACGVAVEMMYSSYASGAYHDDTKRAYKNKFNYSSAVLTRPGANPNFYDDLQTDMVNGRPAQLGISGAWGGHSIVCDGYRSTGTNVFHLNYGWGGSTDGWYSLPGGMPYFSIVDESILEIKPSGSTNDPPVASNLEINPAAPIVTDDLIGSYDYYDQNGDPEGNSEIRWYKNSNLQSSLNDQLTVPASATAVDEQWYFTVRPFDGTDYGNLQTSPAVTIAGSNDPPEANFIGDPILGVSPLTVHFTDLSTGNITSQLWQFGDGETSSKRNPDHTYISAVDRSFDVTLTVTDYIGRTSTITQENYIQISSYIEAAFDAGPTVGFSPLTVEFKEISIGSVDSYLWDFGDGSASDEENPVHVYTEAGVYPVSLSISGPGGTDITEVVDLIDVYDETEHIGFTYLSLVDASESLPGEGWDNAIDYDTYLATGTATVGTDEPWAIFTFDDGLTKIINKVRMMHNTKVGSTENYVTKFKLYTSFDGANFSYVGEYIKTGGSWEDFTISPVRGAKFIKIVVTEPASGWRHIGEFEVYEISKIRYDFSASTINATSPHIANGEDSCLVTINLEDKIGRPVSGIKPDYFRIQASGCNNFYGKVNETEVPGTYVGHFSSYTPEDKIVTVRVYGFKIESSSKYSNTPVIVTFADPVIESTPLVVIDGTACQSNNNDWKKAIDGDSCSLVLAGPKWGDCWAIFGFSGGETKQMAKYRLATNPDVKWPQNQVRQFEVYISTAGIGDADFTKIDEVCWNPGGWYEQSYDAIEAKYIKLVLLEPIKSWRQISEFEIHCIAIPEIFGAQPNTTNKNQTISGLPSSYQLDQNSPNPFNPETVISYQLPEVSKVTIQIYNLMGQNIKTLVNINQQAGKYSILWDGKDKAGKAVSSGIYLYRLNATGENESFTSTKKLTLIR